MPSFTDPYAAAKHFAAAYGVDMERCLAAIRWEMDDIAREDEKDKRGSGRRRLQAGDELRAGREKKLSKAARSGRKGRK